MWPIRLALDKECVVAHRNSVVPASVVKCPGNPEFMVAGQWAFQGPATGL